MPSKTPLQSRFMAYCKGHPNDPKCPDRATVDEFVNADKRNGRLKRAMRDHRKRKRDR